MELEAYIEDILREKRFEDEDPEVYDQLKVDLLASAETAINAMIMANLPEDALESFEEVLDSGSEEKIAAFVKQHIPDIDQKVALELVNFKATYLG